MGATTIAKPFRESQDDYRYFVGEGIDIGCGNDLIVPTARCWDINDGDARYMKGVPNNKYDFVYSSHCLEHLTNIEEGLLNWVRILKPDGYLFVIIPDWYLYEHLVWPPRFNHDHKFTFSLDLFAPRTNHYHIPSTVLPYLRKLGVHIINVRLEDWGVDYPQIKSNPSYDQSCKALTQIAIIGQKRSSLRRDYLLNRMQSLP